MQHALVNGVRRWKTNRKLCKKCRETGFAIITPLWAHEMKEYLDF